MASSDGWSVSCLWHGRVSGLLPFLALGMVWVCFLFSLLRVAFFWFWGCVGGFLSVSCLLTFFGFGDVLVAF